MGKERWPQIAWVRDPGTGSVPGMGHASYPGSTALCGKSAPYLGAPWPKTDAHWSFPFARCPACAQRLYHPARP